MLLRTFTLKFNAVTGQFDEEDLQAFIKDKELVSVREYFFVKHETPYLVVFLTYLPGKYDLSGHGRRKHEKSWKELLSEEQFPLFETLRDWRAERAKREGVPRYIICTNWQLAQIVAARPTTLAGLAQVRGIGKAKVDKYGEELLALLKPEIPEREEDDRNRQKTMFEGEAGSQSQKPTKHKDTT